MEFITTTSGGGGYFKPEEHADAKALLIEPTRYLPEEPNPFGKPGETREILVADVTVFVNKDALEGEVEPVVLQSTRLTAGALVKEYKDKIGKAAICSLQLKPATMPGRKAFWVPKAVDKAAAELVIAYAKKREAEAEAVMDELPDWAA